MLSSIFTLKRKFTLRDFILVTASCCFALSFKSVMPMSLVSLTVPLFKTS